MTRIKRYLAKLFESGATPPKGQHKDDKKMWLDGVRKMAGREEEILKDFGVELAQMVLVYPDATAVEMLEALREHVWIGDWKPQVAAEKRSAPR